MVFTGLTWTTGCLGYCGEHWAQPAIIRAPCHVPGGGGHVYVWPAGFGTCCCLSLEGLSCAFRTGPPSLPEGLRSTTTFSIVASLSLPPARQVSLLWLPQALASHTGVSWYRPAFLSCVPNTVSGMWPAPNKGLWRE